MMMGRAGVEPATHGFSGDTASADLAPMRRAYCGRAGISTISGREIERCGMLVRVTPSPTLACVQRRASWLAEVTFYSRLCDPVCPAAQAEPSTSSCRSASIREVRVRHLVRIGQVFPKLL